MPRQATLNPRMSILNRLPLVADVYQRDSDTGVFSVLVKSGLACDQRRRSSAPAGSDRAEQVHNDVLLYDPSYAMPQVAQVDLDGDRWQIVAHTAITVRGPGGVALYGRAEIMQTGD